MGASRQGFDPRRSEQPPEGTESDGDMIGFARLNHLSGYWAKDGFTMGARTPGRKGAVGWEDRVTCGVTGHQQSHPPRATRHSGRIRHLAQPREITQLPKAYPAVLSSSRTAFPNPVPLVVGG